MISQWQARVRGPGLGRHGRRMKAGVFDLRVGARYWIQMSASPEPTLDLFFAGPLN